MGTWGLPSFGIGEIEVGSCLKEFFLMNGFPGSGDWKGAGFVEVSLGMVGLDEVRFGFWP